MDELEIENFTTEKIFRMPRTLLNYPKEVLVVKLALFFETAMTFLKLLKV